MHLKLNPISFLLHGLNVNSVEIDKPTCKMLRNNLNVYKFDKKKYKIFCKDYTQIYKKLKQDIVFIDPPWGGPAYKKKKALSLYLYQNGKKININDICYDLLKGKSVKLIALKLPSNFNYNKLYKKLEKLNIDNTQYKIYYKKRYKFDLCLLSLNL